MLAHMAMQHARNAANRIISGGEPRLPQPEPVPLPVLRVARALARRGVAVHLSEGIDDADAARWGAAEIQDLIEEREKGPHPEGRTLDEQEEEDEIQEEIGHEWMVAQEEEVSEDDEGGGGGNE